MTRNRKYAIAFAVSLLIYFVFLAVVVIAHDYDDCDPEPHDHAQDVDGEEIELGCHTHDEEWDGKWWSGPIFDRYALDHVFECGKKECETDEGGDLVMPETPPLDPPEPGPEPTAMGSYDRGVIASGEDKAVIKRPMTRPFKLTLQNINDYPHPGEDRKADFRLSLYRLDKDGNRTERAYKATEYGGTFESSPWLLTEGETAWFLIVVEPAEEGYTGSWDLEISTQ